MNFNEGYEKKDDLAKLDDLINRFKGNEPVFKTN